MFHAAAALIGFNLFKTVEIIFPLVGHTHNDIDAMFGTISTFLKAHEVYSPLHCQSVLHESIKKLYRVDFVHGVWDYRKWLEPSDNDNSLTLVPFF